MIHTRYISDSWDQGDPFLHCLILGVLLDYYQPSIVLCAVSSSSSVGSSSSWYRDTGILLITAHNNIHHCQCRHKPTCQPAIAQRQQQRYMYPPFQLHWMGVCQSYSPRTEIIINKISVQGYFLCVHIVGWQSVMAIQYHQI